MPYVERKIYSGDLLEVDCYFSPKGNTAERSKERTPSSAKQIAANNQEAERFILRKLHTNFSSKQKDMFVTFTYAEDVDEETARREIKNAYRRIRRYLRKNNLPELRYAEKTEKQGKWHHHMIMSYIPLDVLTKIWGNGRVSASILDPTNNYIDLAKYLTRQEKPPKGDPDGENIKEARKKFARRWTFSKNLKNPPKPEITEIKKLDILRKPPAAPKGYYLLPDWKIGCDSWGNLYQHYKCIKIDPPPIASKNKRRKKA